MFLTKCVQQFETFKIQFYNKVVLDTMATLCATIWDTTPKALFWVISVGDQERPSHHLETLIYETRFVQPEEHCGIHTFHGFSNKSQHYFMCVCSAQLVTCSVNVVVSELSWAYWAIGRPETSSSVEHLDVEYLVSRLTFDYLFLTYYHEPICTALWRWLLGRVFIAMSEKTEHTDSLLGLQRREKTNVSKHMATLSRHLEWENA